MSITSTFQDCTENGILALSWKAPFGHLMLHGKIETRTWETKYRGWVLICNSKLPYSQKKLLEIAGIDQYNRILKITQCSQNGHAIAIGKLIDCRPMTKADENACFVKYKEPWYENKAKMDGKIYIKKNQLWCHVYENVTPIKPFAFLGSQGWKKLTIDEFNQIELINHKYDLS